MNDQMITLSNEEVDALAAAFGWFANLPNKPNGLASISAPQGGCLHFRQTRSNTPPELPDDAIVLSPPDAETIGGVNIPCESPRHEFARVTQVIDRSRRAASRYLAHGAALVAADAFVDASARLGPNVVIGPRCTIESGVEVRANAVLDRDVKIGRNCLIQPGATIGVDGFGFGFHPEKPVCLIAHLGGVRIEDGAVVGAQALVASGTLAPTRLAQGCLIDGNVYIGHNAFVGVGAQVLAGAVVGGSAIVGDSAVISPLATIKTKVRVGAGATVGLGSAVLQDVADGQTVMGDRAQEIRTRLRREAAIDRRLL